MFTFIGLALILILSPFWTVKPIKRLRDYLKKQLLWNFIIRTFLESGIILAYCVILNLRYGELENIGGYMNYITACVFSIVLISMPFFILFFYLSKYDVMNSEDEEEAE